MEPTSSVPFRSQGAGWPPPPPAPAPQAPDLGRLPAGPGSPALPPGPGRSVPTAPPPPGHCPSPLCGQDNVCTDGLGAGPQALPALCGSPGGQGPRCWVREAPGGPGPGTRVREPAPGRHLAPRWGDVRPSGMSSRACACESGTRARASQRPSGVKACAPLTPCLCAPHWRARRARRPDEPSLTADGEGTMRPGLAQWGWAQRTQGQMGVC